MLTDFQQKFDNAYEDIFNKVLVGKVIANYRYEPVLKFGESVERFALDLSGVKVRTTVRGSNSTIDDITDSVDLLTINVEKEAVFSLPDGVVTQAGPLSPGEVAGMNIAMKVATDLDSRILYETLSSAYDFDTGDLTTMASTGVPFLLDATNIPLFISRAPAKLLRQNQILTGLVMVIDSLAVSSFEQYLMGKGIDLAGAVFKNGYTGTIHGADLYVTENLTAEAQIHYTGAMADEETITINGVVFRAQTGAIAAAGDVDASVSTTQFLTNLEAALNAPQTASGTYFGLSAADLATIQALNITATKLSATDLKIVCRGSGRLILAENQTNATWLYNFMHFYFGKKGAIDVVVQDLKKIDIRPSSLQRASNYFSSYLAGIKTFADGAKKFLDVLAY